MIFFFFFAIGNIFDKGAQAVSHMLENNQTFGLNEALKCIQQRPWLIDGLDNWLIRMEQVCIYMLFFQYSIN